MSNSYKNIIKNLAQKLNEQEMPVQKPEEKVELTQAEKAPLKFTIDTARDMLYNGNMPQTIELDDGTILKYVGSLQDQVKGKVENADSYEFIIVYADENDPNKKYLVYDWDESNMGEIAELAAQSWVKRFESGALPPDAINPYWADIIDEGKTFKFLDGNARSAIAKTIASLKLDTKQAMQTAKVLWGDDDYSLEDIMRYAITSMDLDIALEFLNSDPHELHKIKGDEHEFFDVMRYEFEI